MLFLIPKQESQAIEATQVNIDQAAFNLQKAKDDRASEMTTIGELRAKEPNEDTRATMYMLRGSPAPDNMTKKEYIENLELEVNILKAERVAEALRRQYQVPDSEVNRLQRLAMIGAGTTTGVKIINDGLGNLLLDLQKQKLIVYPKNLHELPLH